MSKNDHFRAYFKLANESEGYEPDLLKENIILWKPGHSQWKILYFSMSFGITRLIIFYNSLSHQEDFHWKFDDNSTSLYDFEKSFIFILISKRMKINLWLFKMKSFDGSCGCRDTFPILVFLSFLSWRLEAGGLILTCWTFCWIIFALNWLSRWTLREIKMLLWRTNFS